MLLGNLFDATATTDCARHYAGMEAQACARLCEAHRAGRDATHERIAADAAEHERIVSAQLAKLADYATAGAPRHFIENAAAVLDSVRRAPNLERALAALRAHHVHAPRSP